MLSSGFALWWDKVMTDPETTIQFWNAAMSGLVFVWVPIVAVGLGELARRRLEKAALGKRLIEIITRLYAQGEMQIRRDEMKIHVDLSPLEAELPNLQTLSPAEGVGLYHALLSAAKRTVFIKELLISQALSESLENVNHFVLKNEHRKAITNLHMYADALGPKMIMLLLPWQRKRYGRQYGQFMEQLKQQKEWRRVRRQRTTETDTTNSSPAESDPSLSGYTEHKSPDKETGRR